MTDLFKSLQNFRAALNTAHLERVDVIDGLLATLLSKQNAFLLGEPGTGKSDLVRSICKGIDGAKKVGKGAKKGFNKGVKGVKKLFKR